MMKTKGDQYFGGSAQNPTNGVGANVSIGGMNFNSLLNNSFMHYNVYPVVLE